MKNNTMDFNEINKQLKKLNTTCSVSDARDLIATLVGSLGIDNIKPEELLIHPSIQREISRFVKAPGFRNQAAAYEIHHDSNAPIDLKLFWLHKTTKANLSWIVALTPNYEDSPENNPNANIGIDFVLSEECDRLFIILSKNLKLRVLELHESLSHTQREIFENWTTFANKLDTNSNTYKEQLQQHLWKSFDFEPTNRKFYQELVTQFDHLVNHLKKEITEEEAKMFAVRFIGRTLFLWFLRKKEFINKDKDYFEVSGSSDQTEYYRTKLEPLFFDVLNTESRARSYDDKITPFLNGGLFEPIETDFYKNEKLTFPDGFFTQFYALLNRYNFTVDEGTSEYEHVAVDPEMLGRVFENLLASINEETGKQARKAKGAFYTPREIVDYMCQQSLVEYLKTKLPETTNRDRRIEELVTMNESEFREQDHNKRRDWKKDLGKEDILKALSEIRVLDPAVGSGAFPMGMLTLLVKVYSRIDTAREKDLSKLKREILSESLYGVDIDQMAIQISRLRAWLSMLVDMESLKKVEPLPNLDFKFVCANTLISLDDGPNTLFDSDVNLKEKLIELRDQYYQATRKTEKNKIRKEYLQNIQTGNLFASEREKQLKDYDPFDPLNSSSFYDPSLMHGVGSFSLIIGNPPYVRADSGHAHLAARIEIEKQEIYTTLYEKWDLMIPFVERGLGLLDYCGQLTYITSNSICTSKYALKLQDLIQEMYFVYEINYFENVEVFNAGVVPVIFRIGKSSSGRSLKIIRENNFENISQKQVFTHEEFRALGRDAFRETFHEFAITVNNKPLGDICYMSKGMVINADEKTAKGAFKKNDLISTFSDQKHPKAYIEGKDIDCYVVKRNKYLEWGTERVPNKLSRKTFPELYDRPKIMRGRVTGGIFDDSGLVCNDSIVVLVRFCDLAGIDNKSIQSSIKKNNQNERKELELISEEYDLKYVLGILNSKFAYTFLNNIRRHRLKNYFYPDDFRKLPIPTVEKSAQKTLIQLVDQVLKTKGRSDPLQQKFVNDIDELVMDIYKLTDEEKEIVRNS